MTVVLALLLMVVVAAAVPEGRAQAVEELNELTLNRLANGETWLALLYTMWCQHCHRVQPEVEKLAAQEGLSFRVARFDCTSRIGLCGELGCQQWPCIVAMRGAKVWEHSGDRSAAGLRSFAERATERSPDRGVLVPPTWRLVWQRMEREAQLVREDVDSMRGERGGTAAAIGVVGLAAGFAVGLVTTRRRLRKAKRD